MPEPKDQDKTGEKFEGKASLSHSGRVLLSAGPSQFDIVIIREGFAVGDMAGGPFMVQGRPLYWTKQGIESGVEVYEGAAVTAFRFGDTLGHLEDAQGTLKRFAVLNEIGRLSNVRVEKAADGLHELRARLTLHEGVSPLIPSVLQSWADESVPLTERGGFSIEAIADFMPGVVDGKAVTQGVRIHRNPDGTSLDMVSHPAAGGRVLKVAASIRAPGPKEKTMPAPTAEELAAAEKAEAEKKIKLAADAEAEKVRQALKDELEAAKAANKDLAEAARLGRVERTAEEVRQSAKDAGLSAKGVDLVAGYFDGAESVKDEDLKAKVEKVAQALGENRGIPTLANRIQLGLEPKDKIELGMEAMFTRSNEPDWAMGKVDGKNIHERVKQAGIERPRSFLRFFEEVTGHEFARGFGDRDSRRRIKQAVSASTFGDAFENVLNRKGVRYFESNPIFQDWKRIAAVVSVSNFVKQERFVMGGYANLATVTEGENYPALTTPGDEGHGYTPTKKGGVESLTREALLRDDVNAIAMIPERMGNAALRTLYEFVFDLVKPSSTTYTMDYDGEYVVDTDHDINNNKGTTALSAAELIVAIKVMQKFRDISVDKRLGVEPGIVLVPIDLGNTLHDILKPSSDYPGGATTDNSFIRQMGLQGIVVRHWTDATDWALLANPSLHPWLEVGFINGQETPQFFFQNDEGLGAMFDADKQLIKTRHEYGGAVLRHEFIYGEVVGG